MNRVLLAAYLVAWLPLALGCLSDPDRALSPPAPSASSSTASSAPAAPAAATPAQSPASAEATETGMAGAGEQPSSAASPALPTDEVPPGDASPSPAPAAAAGSAATPAATEPVPEGELVKAEQGVGKRGRSLDEYEGMLVTPAKAYFSVRERLVFQAQIPSALQLFKATNGNLPQSQEEFMSQIIQANSIPLPELPAGQRYVWDPKTGELMVERPASR